MTKVRYFAGAAESAGIDNEMFGGSMNLGELRAELIKRHGDAFARVLAQCTTLVDGVCAEEAGTPIPSGATVDVLPPFAGG